MDLVSSPSATAERIERLRKYLSTNVLAGEAFICPHAQACRSSHDGQFYEGQLHHVGHHYDLRLKGHPLRVAVVGQEYGHNPIHVTLEARHQMVAVESGVRRRFKASAGHPNRNPHMRGTTSLLRLVFGLGLGTDYAGEFLTLDRQQVHVFDAFALVNFLLCSGAPLDAPPPSRNESLLDFRGAVPGRSSSTMRENCRHHFIRALEILEPTLIVIQGIGTRGWIASTLNLPRRPISLVEMVTLNGRNATVVSFSHPSSQGTHNWGRNERTTYLLNTVKPTLEQALQLD